MKKLKQLFDQITLMFQFESETVSVLDDLDFRISSLENKKLQDAAKFNSLEKRYSELLMLVKQINRNQNSK